MRNTAETVVLADFLDSEKRYRIVPVGASGHLGCSTYSEVLKVADIKNLSEFFAAKILRSPYDQDEKFREHLKYEVNAALKLNHPNIVRVHPAAHTPNGSPIILMEYLEGRTLREELDDRLVRQVGGYSLDEALALLWPVAEALDYAWHECRLIHRDLKPENIFLCGHDPVKIKLIDFGQAALGSRQHTAMFGGTDGYMAPEAFREQGPGTLQRSQDVFALAVILYVLLDPQHQKPGSNPVKPAALDVAQWQVLSACWHVHPASRPQSGREMLEQLRGQASRKAKHAETDDHVAMDLDERRWQLSLNKIRRSSDPHEKIAAYEAHLNDPEISYCRHAKEAQLRIRELEQAERETKQEDGAASKALLRHDWPFPVQPEAGVEEDSCQDPKIFMPSRAGEVVPKLCEQAPEMVAIPPGKFLMGSPEIELERCDDEGPQHEVHIGYWLAIGKYAVTREEFRRFISETRRDMQGAHFWNGNKWGYDTQRSWVTPGFEQSERDPVVCVSWDDAQTYIKWLNGKAGLDENSPNRYRLLSEAEWEYACRAGTKTAFCWGNSLNTNQANYDGNFSYNGSPRGEYRGKTLPVDSFTPNPWGLYQMHGNVCEWVEDGWHANYTAAPNDGRVWAVGADMRWRVLRGGSWVNLPWILRSAIRNGVAPSNRYYSDGFRLARTLP